MERIELFDKYINNQLSDAQRSEFDAKLKSDEDFAADFKVYLLTVDGICREAHQDDIDFGVAMKSISKDQLKEIIGQQNIQFTLPSTAINEENITIRADRVIEIPDMASRRAEQRLKIQEEDTCRAYDQIDNNDIDVEILASSIKPSHKHFKFKSWIWQAASAAILIIAFTLVFNIEKNARYSVDNAIYACADINPDLARAGSEQIDITSMDDVTLKENLPVLISIYQSSYTPDEIADNGFALAMAYLRLHDRENTKKILEQLVVKFEGNEDYDESVNKWKSILSLLK